MIVHTTVRSPPVAELATKLSKAEEFLRSLTDPRDVLFAMRQLASLPRAPKTDIDTIEAEFSVREEKQAGTEKPAEEKPSTMARVSRKTPAAPAATPAPAPAASTATTALMSRQLKVATAAPPAAPAAVPVSTDLADLRAYVDEQLRLLKDEVQGALNTIADEVRNLKAQVTGHEELVAQLEQLELATVDYVDDRLTAVQPQAAQAAPAAPVRKLVVPLSPQATAAQTAPDTAGTTQVATQQPTSLRDRLRAKLNITS